MNSFRVHPSSTVASTCTLGDGVEIGPNCVVEGRTSIGDRTILLGDVTLLGDAEIGSDCRFEAGVVATREATTRVGSTRAKAPAAGPLVVGARAHVGAGAVLAAGIRIGADAWIETGSVVARDIPAHAIVQGDPAAVVGFGGQVKRGADLLRDVGDRNGTGPVDCEVAGVKLYRFPRITDSRGSLTFGEFERHVPFAPKRFFLVYGVPEGELRGGHAHASCAELLLSLGGSITVAVDDGRKREEIVLDEPDIALYLPERVWGVQYRHSPGAVMLCLASHYYDPKDYIYDYDEFVARMKR